MKNIIIVGAGKGIGLKTAQLLNNGNNLVTISRNSTVELEDLNTHFYKLDITKDSLDTVSYTHLTLPTSDLV